MSIDPELSRLYRAGSSEEPPRALDEVILAAARRDEPRAEAGFRQRASRNWQIPFALAAVITLTVSLVLVSGEHTEQSAALIEPGTEAIESDRGPGDRFGEQLVGPSPSPGASRRSEGALESRPSRESASPEPRGDRPDAGRAAAGAAPSAKAAQPQAPESSPQLLQRPGVDDRVAPAAPVPPTAQVPERLEKEGASLAMPEQSAPRRAPAARKVPHSARAPTDVAEPIGRAKRESENAASAPEVYPTQPLAKPASPAAPAAAPQADEAGAASPEELLREIEQLRRDGRLDEARVRLEAFRKRYPSYALPPALQ